MSTLAVLNVFFSKCIGVVSPILSQVNNQVVAKMNAWNTAKLNLQHVSASQIIRYIRIHVQLFLTLRHSSNVIEGREVP